MVLNGTALYRVRGTGQSIESIISDDIDCSMQLGAGYWASLEALLQVVEN